MKKLENEYRKCLYFSANALARKTEKLAQESWSKVDLTPSHGYLLMLVIEQPGIQPTLIASCLHLTPSTVTRLILKLESKKLLYRTTEGKITNVYPTTKGNNLLPKLQACQREFFANYAAILGAQESTRLALNMVDVADRLKD
ncbi:MAG TPA: MarR family transcriptional regulator [Ohtaekwangia sp.]|uniref:MarR family winged helix-turn-helix transcriptional regulator n=1 Tax=Ohtaekwangia sp. TaxID=2066019 RepID=UPI002F9439FB